MKISKETLAVLKNFSVINNSIAVDEDQILKIRSIAGNIIGVYDTSEVFPNFGLYNLSEFLNIINLFPIEEIDFEFLENRVSISCNKNKVSYNFCDMDMIPHLDKIKTGKKYKSISDFIGSFKMSADEIQKFQKASNIMGLGTMSVTMNDGNGQILLLEDSSHLSNKFDLEISGSGDVDISVMVENLQIIPGDYTVSVFQNKILKFQHNTAPLFYLVSGKVKK